MQVSESDEEMDVEDEQPRIETEEPDVNVDEDEEADELSDKEDELEDDEDEGSDVDVEAAEPGPRLPSGLRIKFKFTQQASEASSVAATTPDGSSRRRILSRGSDVESEDEDEDEDDSDSVVATPGRPLTARQAVLRNVVDPSHVSLAEPPNPRKKKPLTELEMALKREETARKRKNLSEKKLEDEKAETINRLLKKQSRARGKRNALSTAEDRPTPGVGQEDMEEGEEMGSQTPAPPTMYRWVSTTKVPPVEGSDERRMLMTFSVPVSIMSHVATEQAQPASTHPPPTRPACDVEGCTAQRKYRLVKDWHKGACSMTHLKALEAK